MMIMDMRKIILLIMLSFMLAFDGSANTACAEEGIWSKQAFSIPLLRAFKVPSPDRKKTILIEDLSLVVIDGGSAVPGIEGYTLLLPAEISWAPDSKAFVITSNEEGSGDEAWFITVYLLEYDRVKYYDVTAEAGNRFKELIKCPDAGEPHFGAIKWVKESKNLLVVARRPDAHRAPRKERYAAISLRSLREKS
jgi:hypothetical protein